jgi:hypothetical protein
MAQRETGGEPAVACKQPFRRAAALMRHWPDRGCSRGPVNLTCHLSWPFYQLLTMIIIEIWITFRAQLWLDANRSRTVVPARSSGFRNLFRLGSRR